MHFIFIYILFSVVHMSLVKQCIFLCTLRSICYVRIKIKACMNNAKYSSNSCIGYKLSFFRNHFYLDMDSDLKLSVTRLSVNRLDLTQQVILDNILSLLNVRTGVSEIEIFSLNQVNTMINYLSTD